MTTRRILAAAIGLLVVAGCSSSDSTSSVPSTSPIPATCNSFLPATRIGRLQLADGATIEGAVASRRTPDALWLLVTGADGTPAAVAVGLDGRQYGSIDLDGVLPSVTDLALGPGPDPDRDYLYVADAETVLSGGPLVVARVGEPGPGEFDTAPDIASVELLLPDGAGFPEAMLVDFESGDIYIATESRDATLLLRAAAPSSGATTAALQVEASIDSEAARGLAGAAVDGAGATIAFRTAAGVSLWRRSNDAGLPEAIAEPACVGLFAEGRLDTALALRDTDLLSIDRSTHRVDVVRFPVDLDEPGRSGPAGNLAPQVEIISPSPTLAWEVGAPIEVEAAVTDDQPVDAAGVAWELVAVRCPTDGPCETQILDTARGSPGRLMAESVGVPVPVGIELRATYADPAGLTRSAAVALQPRTATVELASDPAGAEVTIGRITGVTPYRIDAVVGDRVQVDIVPVQPVDGTAFEYAAWSDGGGRSHEVTIDAAATTLTAALRPERGHIRFTGSPGTFGFARIPLPSSATVVDVRAWVALDDWTPDSDLALLGSQGKSLVLGVTEAGRLRASLELSSGAAIEAVSTASVDAVSAERLWVRAVLDASTGVVVFSTSRATEADGLSVEWVQLGDPVETGESGRVSSIPVLALGQENRGSARPLIGKLFGAAWLADGRLVTRIDFSATSQLTSAPPNYSVWGPWSMVGSGWQYVAEGSGT